MKGGLRPLLGSGYGVTRDVPLKNAGVRPVDQRHHIPVNSHDMTFYRGLYFGCPEGPCDFKKIIIICKINQLFCQIFQHRHHSFTNRLAVSQRPLASLPGYAVTALRVIIWARKARKTKDPNRLRYSESGDSDCSVYVGE